MFSSRSLFDILKAYTQSVGDIHNYDAQQQALLDTDRLAAFARSKVGVELEASLAEEISEAGLHLLTQIRQHPDQEESFWAEAKHTLDD